MLDGITVKGFKSYRVATLRLAPLTLLIGANASGKSNAIEAIRFLSWLAHGTRLDDILQSVQQTDVSIRGTLGDLTYPGRDDFSLACSARSDPVTHDWPALEITVAASPTEMWIRQEHILDLDTEVPLYEVIPETGEGRFEVQVAYNNFARGGRKPRIPCSNRQAIFTQLDTPSRFAQPRSQRTIVRVVQAYQKLLRQILFLDPEPRRMRDYSFIIDKQLKGDGSNLSSVLYNLCEEQNQKEKVLEFVRSLPEQDIQDIRFLETPRREVMIQLAETFAREPRTFDAPLLSDGTLRVLAVAAALLSAPESSTVIIEEIDNGVHPSRVGALLEQIQGTARRRRLRVLITSHNPALLDALPDDAVPDVVFCYRDPSEGDSRLARLEDLASYPELVARGPLGQMMTAGVLDNFVKTRRTPEQKRAVGEKWLHEFREAV